MNNRGRTVNELGQVTATKTIVTVDSTGSQHIPGPAGGCFVAPPEHEPVLELSLARALLELVVRAHSGRSVSACRGEDLSSKAS